VCVDFHREGGGGIYRGEWDPHRLGEVGLVPGGGWAAKPHGWPAEWSGFHRLGLLLLVSTHGNQVLSQTPLNPGHPTKELGRPASPRAHSAWGLGSLGTCVKYTSVIIMILIFGQLHLVNP
jgi:hypothetical protein